MISDPRPRVEHVTAAVTRVWLSVPPRCRGNESSLDECDDVTWGAANCDDANVTWFRCGTGARTLLLMDGRNDTGKVPEVKPRDSNVAIGGDIVSSNDEE